MNGGSLHQTLQRAWGCSAIEGEARACPASPLTKHLAKPHGLWDIHMEQLPQHVTSCRLHAWQHSQEAINSPSMSEHPCAFLWFVDVLEGALIGIVDSISIDCSSLEGQ